jgi:hypothetical protein
MYSNNDPIDLVIWQCFETSKFLKSEWQICLRCLYSLVKLRLKCFIKFNFAAIFSFNEIVNMKISFRNRFAVSVQT